MDRNEAMKEFRRLGVEKRALKPFIDGGVMAKILCIDSVFARKNYDAITVRRESLRRFIQQSRRSLRSSRYGA
jgi:hypothetical protein